MTSTKWLSGFAIFGTVLTAVTTSIGTQKATKKIQKKTEEKGSPLTKKEKFKAASVHYIIPLISFLGTTVCILCAEKINAKTIAGLSATVIALKKTYKKYEQAVKDIFGVEGEALVKQQALLTELEDKTVPEMEELYYIGYGYDDYFKAKPSDIERAEYLLNKNIRSGYTVSVADFFDAVGLEPTNESIEYGWSLYDLTKDQYKDDVFDRAWLEIQFNTIDCDGDHPACEIDFSIPPSDNFIEHYRWFKDDSQSRILS